MANKVGYLFKEMNLICKLAWAYAAIFIFVVALGYIPGLTNAEGQLLGLFEIEFHDDILHLASGIWAAFAAWSSTRAAIFYFKTFGVLYGLDGLVGLMTGYGYLDGGIFFAHAPAPYDFVIRLAVNIPHMLIGGTAVVIGFVLSRKYTNHA